MPTRLERITRMVYISTWSEFLHRAEDMVQQHPQRVRLVLRYKHSKGEVLAKVTDDVECLQYRPRVDAEVDKLLDLQGMIMASLTSPAAAQQAVEERETRQRKSKRSRVDKIPAPDQQSSGAQKRKAQKAEGKIPSSHGKGYRRLRKHLRAKKSSSS
eukprot:gb/GECG01004110.1/.p1 GENE.gb/GECG01004110.1/~~gb/GECG01004110.1/.p1  ORF type:complete len:157 (+),score=24.31 gb/GECG01004110.1/:1-471(+)